MSALLDVILELCGKCFYYFLKFVQEQKTEVKDLEDTTETDWDDLEYISPSDAESDS
jgi:hypothetical protein